MKKTYRRVFAVMLIISTFTFGAYSWSFAWMSKGAFHQGGFSTLGLTVLASGAEKVVQGEPQRVCPISGQKVDKSISLDYQGKRIYFCCASCKKAFLADPQKYIEAMEAKGVVLETAP